MNLKKIGTHAGADEPRQFQNPFCRGRLRLPEADKNHLFVGWKSGRQRSDGHAHHAAHESGGWIAAWDMFGQQTHRPCDWDPIPLGDFDARPEVGVLKMRENIGHQEMALALVVEVSL